MDNELKTLEWAYENDGWGIIGVSFECPYCLHNNRFVDGDLEPHECERCHKESMPTVEADD